MPQAIKADAALSPSLGYSVAHWISLLTHPIVCRMFFSSSFTSLTRMLVLSHWGLPLSPESWQVLQQLAFWHKPSPIDPTNQASYAHTPHQWIPTLLSLPTNW